MAQHDPRDMLLFARVVELQSLTAAAAAAGIGKASVSRAITRLEARLKLRLLDRSPRRTSATEAGMVFYERCRRISEAMCDAESAIATMSGQFSGVLRIRSSITIGQSILSILLPDFLREQPGLTVRLELSNRGLDSSEPVPDVHLLPGHWRIHPSRRAISA